jgi:SAM-dependent methyltransferase
VACPSCHEALGEPLSCAACGRSGTREGTRLNFGGLDEAEVRGDPLNRVKETAKHRLGRAYPLAISALSPVLSRNLVRPFLRTFDLDRELVADLGSGTHRHDPRVICVDGSAYSNVDLVSDLKTLPIADGALSGVLSIAVLEHVPDPAAHVAEMHRVLAPGGRVLCYVPFLAPFHASPHDYHRWTRSGLATLFGDFEMLRVRVGAGPTSALLWMLEEWLALVLSLGSRRLYRILTPLMWVLSPLKIIDVLLARHLEASVVASGFVIEARKRPPA